MPTLRTTPIYTDNPGSLPAQYVVPGTLELTLQSIVARYDGSGAGGTFLPCVSIYTQDGRLVSRVRTDQEFLAGDTGVVTFGPFLRRQKKASGILQAYAGQATAADFTFNSTVYVSSGFPNNPTFTKLSSTSLLDIRCTGDFTASATVPNMLQMGLFIDGGLEEATGVHVARASTFISATWTKVVGAGFTSGAPLAAGAHTLDLKVAIVNGATNAVFRTSDAVDLQIIEFEP